ncbi:MAG: hypothetical protein IJB83_01230 [Bacilli bacterium]|nr:hypothetical protein [Bacilli bacterium]
MDKDYYVIFSFNDNDKLLFVEKHEKDDTILKVKTYSEWLEYAKSIGYEVVDISLWKYENYEEKCLQVQNYNKMLKKEVGSTEKGEMAYRTCDGQAANTMEEVMQYNKTYCERGFSKNGDMQYMTCDGQAANTMEEVTQYNKTYCERFGININEDELYSEVKPKQR